MTRRFLRAIAAPVNMLGFLVSFISNKDTRENIAHSPMVIYCYLGVGCSALWWAGWMSFILTGQVWAAAILWTITSTLEEIRRKAQER